MIYSDSFMDALYGPVEDLAPRYSEEEIDRWIQSQKMQETNNLPEPVVVSEITTKMKKKGRQRHDRHGRRKRTVFQRSNWSCHYCGRPDKLDKVRLTLDHVLAKSKGGGDGNKNLVACCPDCNQAKEDMSKEAFLKLRPDLKAMEQNLNYLNGMNGRPPWCGNPYSDLYNVKNFWSNYFGA